MSVISDIIIILDIQELFDDNFEILSVIPGINNINTWLEAKGCGILDRLDEHVQGGGKAMQIILYGGAFNFLDNEHFIDLVKSQTWKYPESFCFIVNSENDPGPHIFGFDGDVWKERT